MKRKKIVLMFLLIFTVIPLNGAFAQTGGIFNGYAVTHGIGIIVLKLMLSEKPLTLLLIII